MIDEQKAVSLATQRLQQIYPEPKFLYARRRESLEAFEAGVSGWRIYFYVEDADFGNYDRPVEVSDLTQEARLVMLYM